MRKSSIGRKSSTNPMRFSAMDRDEKNYASSRSEPRVSSLARPIRQSGGESSQIPRPRIRSASSERASSIRKSNLKVPVAGKTSHSGIHHVATTPVTPRVSSHRVHPDLPSGIRGRSPSAERASGLSANSGQRKDTRPITDKNYQTAMLNRIDNFLRDASQTSIMNPSGSIKPISLKMFVTVSDFLLQLLDIKHDFTINNYMEELPKIAKKLHYPGTITKSWLKTANTMHAWHHVLAWLSWLVEICEVKDIATRDFQLEYLPFTDEGDGGAINRDQFMEMLKLYQVWNEGKEDEERMLIEKYIEGIADHCGCNEEDTRIAQLELDEVTKKHEEIIKHGEEIDQIGDTLRKQLEALREDERRQIMHKKSLEEFVMKQESEIQKLDSEQVYLNQERQKHLKQHEELNSLIVEQPMTVEEREKILEKCSEIQSYMKQFDDHLDEIQKEAFMLDIKSSNVLEKLRKAILAYNTDIVINVTQDKDELKMPESSLAAPDIMIRLNEKVEAILNLKETMMKQMQSCKSMIQVQTNELESLQEKKKMMDQEASEWLVKIDEKRVCIKNLKSRATKEETTLRDLIKKLEDDIKHLQQTMPDVQSILSDIAEAREKFDAVQRRKLFLERSAERFFTRFYEIISHDRKEVVKIIEDIDKQKI